MMSNCTKCGNTSYNCMCNVPDDPRASRDSATNDETKALREQVIDISAGITFSNIQWFKESKAEQLITLIGDEVRKYERKLAVEAIAKERAATLDEVKYCPNCGCNIKQTINNLRGTDD